MTAPTLRPYLPSGHHPRPAPGLSMLGSRARPANHVLRHSGVCRPVGIEVCDKNGESNKCRVD